MTIAAQRWYPVPDKSNPVANFSSWCHITQVFQADFYKSQIMFYRRGSGMPERQLGSLYWQLEDIWQAPTWAGIEYDGRWKMLHYTAKDIYQNVIITPFGNGTGDLEVYVTSDLWSSASGTAEFTWYDWSGNVLNISTPTSADFEVGAINTTRVLQTNLNDILGSYDPLDVVLRTKTTVQGQLPNNDATQTFSHENWFHAAPLSHAHLVDPGLQLTVNDDSISVEATTGVAAWVWLDYPAGALVQFEENGFWMKMGETREVGYKVVSDTTGGAWANNITVESLWDMTTP